MSNLTTAQPAEQATPRPWAVNDTGLITSTIGNVRFIARVETHDGPWLDKEDRANAELIVRSVNQSAAFGVLVEAVDLFVADLESNNTLKTSPVAMRSFAKVRAALAQAAKARGETS